MIKLKVNGYSSDYINKLEKALGKHLNSEGFIGVKVSSAEKVRILNKQYAGDDYATDVLSFSYIEDGSESPELGDIVISQNHIKDQAKLAGTPEETEFILLTLHGVLHILGYDHRETEDLKQMDRFQHDIMQELGLKYRNFGWHKAKG